MGLLWSQRSDAAQAKAGNGVGGAAVELLRRCLLRASAEAREKAGNANGALGFTGERWGLMWRTTARRGLAGQRNGDARRHAASKL